MKPLFALASLLLAVFLAASWPPSASALETEPATTTNLPSDSVYHLAVPLTDQDGKPLRFADGRDGPRLVSMFYTSCQFVCPLIIDTLKKTERELPEVDRARLDVLLVSIDPERDTSAALKRTAEQHGVDVPRWRLARTAKPDVRRLAAVLGIQYKQLENHEFSHSSVLVLLDAQGRIVARSSKLGEVDADFVAAIERTLGSSRREPSRDGTPRGTADRAG
ncbi:SCO family protein [Dokdonella ginsengisoli]|uniref:SCO family protein n=1 Tax=Dokdonella ginsengisoli TaxID=363846 RepID=A0ABV9R0W9_9GAMM